MPDRGALITIEGVDGAGKTTLAASLAAALEEQGRDVVSLREPGGVAVAERIRALVTEPEAVVGARAEALLYAAARAQLVDERIAPALDAGQWVLLDRFVDSSLAYQGAGRELGIAAIRELNVFATRGVPADRTLLLSLDPAIALARARGREAGGGADRIEAESLGFFQRVAGAYAVLAEGEPERFRVIDAARPAPLVLADALTALAGLDAQFSG